MNIPTQWLNATTHQVEVWTEHLLEPVLIGRLNYRRASRIGLFDWSEEAQQRALELSPASMPLKHGLWTSAEHPDLPDEYAGLPGLLSDSLPDGWGLYLMDKALGRLGIGSEVMSPAVRLAYLGNRAWGSLTFRPVIDGESVEEMTLSALGEGMEASIDGHIDDVTSGLLRAGSSPQGARPKVMVDLSEDLRSARISAGRPPGGYQSWLIKFASRDEPADAPLIEQAYMICAERAGLRVMHSQILNINGKPAFATKRFDRTESGRVFCHSLGGLLNVSHRTSSTLHYGHVASLMKHLAVPTASLREAYSRAVFNVAMSVRDDHSKNFAFLLDGHNRWDVTPAYDLTYTEGPGQCHTMMVSEEQGRDPTRAHLLDLAAHYDIDFVEAGQIIDTMLDVASQLGQIAKQLGAEPATIKPITKRLADIAKSLGCAHASPSASALGVTTKPQIARATKRPQ